MSLPAHGRQISPGASAFRSQIPSTSEKEGAGRSPGTQPALPLPPTGTREAAFVYAISSAGVAFAVTRACSSGELEKCGCDRTVHGVSPQGKCGRWGGESGRAEAWPSLICGPFCPPAPGFQWSGCSDNIAYGVAFSQSFVDVRERSKGASSSRALMNLHNNEAGRKVAWHFFCPITQGQGRTREGPDTLSHPHATQKTSVQAPLGRQGAGAVSGALHSTHPSTYLAGSMLGCESCVIAKVMCFSQIPSAFSIPTQGSCADSMQMCSSPSCHLPLAVSYDTAL